MKAQMEIFNLVIATVVMVVLAAIGLLWYSSQGFNSNYATEDAAFVASRLPEIECSYRGQPITGCIDLLRAEKLGAEYFDSFGYSTITVNYLENFSAKNLTLYENRKPAYREKKVAELPVNVYNSGVFYTGKIRAEVYR